MIGIDFGTTNSCVAFADEYLGDIEIASVAPLNTPPYDGVLSTSVLDPLGQQPVLGYRAEQVHRSLPAAQRESLSLLTNFKPYLNQPKLRKKVRVVASTKRHYDGLQQIDVERNTYRDEYVGKGHPREELIMAIGLLLRPLIERALESGAELDRLLLGTPVAFSSRARKRMVSGLYETGLFSSYAEIIEKTRFVPEPVAAAAMGMREAVGTMDRERVLVFDHGGGTLDLSLIEFERRDHFDFLVPVRELAPPSGVDGVAGKAFDLELMHVLCRDSSQVRRELEQLGEQQALSIVRDVKEKLSIDEQARLAVLEDEDASIVTRDLFETSVAPLLGDIQREVGLLLRDGGMGVDDVDRVLMTGGTSLIPCVQEKVREMFPRLSDESRIRAYDAIDPGDVERAITEIAQGLTQLGGDDADFRRAVIWDVELLDSDGERFETIAERGRSYDKGDDGRPMFRKRVQIQDQNGNGMALGLWEAQLGKKAFLCGIAEIPPTEGPMELEVTLRPDALYPTLRLLDRNGEPVQREEEFGWLENRMVAADLESLGEGQLGEFFDQDEVDYLPTARFKQFRHVPLTRFIALGDNIEWVEHRIGRSPVYKAGEVEGIRRLGSHEPLSEAEEIVLVEHRLSVRLESNGATTEVTPAFGTVRIRP